MTPPETAGGRPEQMRVRPIVLRVTCIVSPCPIVLFLIGHGLPAWTPPPISVTFLPTVIPFSRMVLAPKAVMFPLMLMLELSVGSTVHVCPVMCPGGLGRQPKPRSEPENALTLPLTVMVDGALCASRPALGPA